MPLTPGTIALIRKGQLDEAIAAYRKATELQPDDARAHFGIPTSRIFSGGNQGRRAI